MKIELTKPSQRGYSMLYRPNEANRCPGCGRSHWYVGRFSAECSFCAAALPMAGAGAAYGLASAA